MKSFPWVALLGLGVAVVPGGGGHAFAADDLPPVHAIAVGEFDGDRFPDFVVGIPGASTRKLKGVGEVRAYSGAKGKLLFTLAGRVEEEGYSDAIVAIGDIDGDRCADLAIGSEFGIPRYRVDYVSGRTGRILATDARGGSGRGVALCALGDGSGKDRVPLLIYQRLSRAWFLVDPPEREILGALGDPAGYAAKGVPVGDVDGDGSPDVAMTDYSEDADGIPMAGRIRVHSGEKLRAGMDEGAEILLLRGRAERECLGMEVAAAGDWDGDGKGDLLAGTSGGADENAPWSVRVLSGKDGSELWRVTGEKGDYAIGGITLTGDVDGDGKPDVAVGSPGRKGKSGAIAVVSAKDGKVLWEVAGKRGETLGNQVLPIADADGDGFPDLCVTATGKLSSYVRYYSGKTGEVISTFNPFR